MAIERFSDDYHFLSNMYPLTNWLDTPVGIFVPTSEHGYQLDKFVDPALQARIARTQDGKVAKQLAHELLDAGAERRPDFNDRKLEIMRFWVREKFTANEDIAEKLVATGNEELIEGNTWDDTVWGVCPPGSRNGQNWLGIVLMDLRQELQGHTETELSFN